MCDLVTDLGRLHPATQLRVHSSGINAACHSDFYLIDHKGTVSAEQWSATLGGLARHGPAAPSGNTHGLQTLLDLSAIHELRAWPTVFIYNGGAFRNTIGCRLSDSGSGDLKRDLRSRNRIYLARLRGGVLQYRLKYRNADLGTSSKAPRFCLKHTLHQYRTWPYGALG